MNAIKERTGKMYITKAVKRLGWRFSEAAKKESRSLKINLNDIQALESIADYVEHTQIKQYDDQTLFAKLFVYLYMKILQNDQTTVMDSRARKKIYNLIRKPLPQIIEEFQKSLNESEQYSLMEVVNDGQIKHPATQNEKEKAANLQKLKDLKEDPHNRSKLYGEVWEYQMVLELVEAEVNQAINYFSGRKK